MDIFYFSFIYLLYIFYVIFLPLFYSFIFYLCTIFILLITCFVHKQIQLYEITRVGLRFSDSTGRVISF